MHREMVPLGWLVRISVVALLAVAALALPGAPAVEAQAIATPTISSIVPGDGQLTVHWTVPEPAPLINSYKVQWKSGGQNYSALARQITAGENDRSRTITGLSNGTQYTVRVIAKTWDNETISAEQTATAGTPAAAAAASASQDRIQLTSARVSYQGLAEEDSWRGISLHFDGPVTDQDQITIKYTLEPLNGASAADFGVAVNEQVTMTVTGRLVIGKFRSRLHGASIPVIDDTLAEEGERVRVTIQEVGHTWLGESTGNQTTGTYHIYDLDSLQYWRSDDDNWTYNVPIADNDSLPDGPSNLRGEVWGTDRVHLRWQPGEDGGTVNDVEQPLRYQFKIFRLGKGPVQFKTYRPSHDWADMDGDNISSFTIQDPAINLGLETYEFWVRAASDAGASEETGPVTLGTLDFPPAPPKNLTATVTGPNLVRLDWDPSAHGGYINGIEQPLRYAYRVENIEDDFREIPGEGITSYTLNHVNLCCNDYTFQIRAFNDHGHSWTSGDIVPTGRVPTPPSNLTATAAGPTSVELRWERSESGGNAPGSQDELPVRYQYRIENLGTEWRDIPGGDVTSHTVPGLDLANNTYTFQVRAANDVGPSWTSGDIPGVGMVDLVGPSITGVSLTSNPEDGVLDTGEPVQVAVTFDEAVVLAGKPRFALDVGGVERLADLDSHAGNAIFFEYTVVEGDTDEDGIGVPANPFRPDPGTTIQDAAGNDANLDHAAVGPDSNHRVNLAPETTGPTIASVAIGSDPGGDGVYGEGDEIRVGVAFAPPGRITVTGSPQLTLDIGGKARIADYKTANYDGVTILVFAYTVKAGDGDDDGISIPANAIDLNGGTITGADHDANLTHAAVPADAGHRVDTPPSIRYVILINITEQGRTYTEGEQIELEVGYTEPVTVTGEPRLVLDIGGQTRHAELQRGAEGASLFFAYTVAPGDQDHDGIIVPGDVINLNGGTITDAGGNAADLTFPELGEGAQWVQFLVDAAPPRLHDVEAPAEGDRVVVTFSEEIFPAPLLLRAAQAVGVNPGVFNRALFNVYVDGFEVVPSHASIAGNDLVLGVAHPFGDLSDVRVSYNNLFARAVPGILVDLGGNPLQNFATRTAANNSQFTPEPSDEENDQPVGLRLSPAEITLVEGGTASYTVALAHEPPEGEEVRVAISSVPDGLLDVSPQSLTFTAGNWDQPQTVEIGSLTDRDDFDNWVAIVHVPKGGGVPYPAYVRLVIEESDR